MTCKHRATVYITEMANAYTTHCYDCGTIWHDSNFDNYTGALQVECAECGLKRYYSRGSFAPKWVKDLLATMLEHQQRESSRLPQPREQESYIILDDDIAFDTNVLK
jgi:hypothetical protein